ncbi:MAG: M28 family metallopeptidase [Alphaproteobacteria bacterium]|nr:M28 family metallopeptidase [Alphaproteobacteria bacterium]
MLENVDPWDDFAVLCGLGGRLCGTPSESQARAILAERLRSVAERHGGRFSSIPLAYQGWRARSCTLQVDAAESVFQGYPLLHSPPTAADGLALDAIDLGRGDEADFEARKDEIPGRAVLTRHEFMFSEGHVHRNRKYRWAEAFGAAAFLIAGGEDQEGPVGGGVGFGDPAGIPAVGISSQAAVAVAGAGGRIGSGAPIVLTIDAEAAPAETETLILELPGESDEWVVLSAHLDGHDLAQSAIDNASGVAAALAAAEAVAAQDGPRRRGLRLCLFSIEEWGLLGSHAYVAGLDEAVRRAIGLNVNLDSVAGAGGLAALWSGFAPLAAFLRDVSEACDIPLALHEPLVRNSDHYNFAVAGIPACRLMAGFDMPKSNMRHVLTAEDTIDKVTHDELRLAAELTAQIVWRACSDEALALRVNGPAPGP